MSGFELAALWFAWALAGASPGPATLGIASTSMAHGRRSGLLFALGILTGGATWGIAAALGMSALMMANAWVFEVLRYVGAAYLIYLAAKSLHSAMSDKPGLTGKARSGTPWRIYTKGVLVHLTNPKAILSWGAIYAIALPPDASGSDLAFMFCFLYSGGVVVFISYAFLFSSQKVVQGYTRARRSFEGAFALLFGAAGLKILTTRVVA
ncbi:LysE family translocator [Yoonia sp. 2307UL14-13]|uniref:LysE family translocator n=1 Tax=Yoonia sp. 2307UL14-13 TaxID=3126506 RepID=UPI0030A0F6F3